MFSISSILILYFIGSVLITTVLAKIPRQPVNDKPDWGIVEECLIPTRNKKILEGWIVYPEHLKNETDDVKLKNNPTIILIHGWGRDRGRMTSRARFYGRNGYTTILISARDHGHSDKEVLGMSILRFSQDLEACLHWWGTKVILNGHSIGGGASLLVASRNPNLVRAVIAESAPHAFPYGLKYVYRPALRWLTPFFLPGITLVTLFKYRKFTRKDFSPFDASSDIKCPIFLIHGKEDKVFPHKYTPLLKEAIGPHCNIWIPDHTDHHNIEDHPQYEGKVIEFLNAIKS
jgi:pimeloyl-ACP methyl ester carboxylesterase